MSPNPKALETAQMAYRNGEDDPNRFSGGDKGRMSAAITAYLAALPPPAEAGELVRRLRAQAYLINGADQIGSRLYSDAADLIESLSARLETVTRALTQIAAFDDALASDRLGSNGSYGSFDEPGSVQIAREALAALKDPPNV